MKKLYLFCCISLLLNQKIVAQVSGVKTIPGDYSSITDAISQIRIAGVSGPTFLELQPAYNSASETFPINLRVIPGISAVNSLTISPAAGATNLSIISASSGPVINLIGASNIIIDGRPGRTGTARQLTIRNNAAEGNAVSFVDGAVENKVTWCILEGRHVPNVGGVVFFGRSGEPIPVGVFLENSANELSNNNIRTINLASITIYSSGGDPVYNSGNKIINNEITGFRRHGISMSGFNSGWTITGNSFYNPDPFVISNDMSVIQFGGAPPGSAINNVISGNFIGGQTPHAGASKWNADYIWGISLMGGSFTVENNIIQNFNMVQGSVDVAIFIGISVTNDASASISGNLIGGSSATNGDIVMTGDKINCIPVQNGSCGVVSITNNKIGNFTLLANISSQFIGIASVGASNPVITGNEIDALNNTSTGLIDFKAILLRPNVNCPVTPPPAVLDYNLIKNITLSSSDDDDVSFTGIEIGGTNTQSLSLHNNQVYKINVSSPNAAVSFAGISINDRISGNNGNIIGSGTEANSIMITGKTINASAIFVNESPDASISDDIIGNITVNGTLSAAFKGITIQGGGKAAVTGNQLKDLSISSSGSSNMVGVGFNGAVTGSEISTLHNNHVYKINVSSSGGEASFAGIKVNDRIAANNGNIVGSPVEANSIMVTGKAANVTAILVNESADVSISDDILGNITVNGTLAAALKGIHIQGGSKANVTGNEIKDFSVSSSGTSDMTGIIFNGAVTGSETSTLHNNHIHKINVSSSDGAASFTGIRINDRIAANNGNVIGSPAEANSIMVNGKSAAANGVRINNSADVSVSDDIIANITANGTLNPGSVSGILFEGGLAVKIDSNNIHHLTAPVARGVLIQTMSGSSTVTIEKNILTGLNTANGKGIETSGAGGSLNLIAKDNTINNWQTGVLLGAASGATLQLSFQNNSVVANQTGFVNNNGTPVNATCNWWGNASGPSGAGPGTGNPVGPNVIFSPWATLSAYVAVNAGPDQTITGSGSKTLNPTYTFCGTATYLWSTGATTASITVSPVVTTVYTIKVTDANGHEATDEVTVFVQAVSLPKINILPTAVIEGNNGTNSAIFILYLSKISAVPVTVQYQASNNTATAPQDYVQKSGTVTFPANSLVGLIQTITIQVKGDVLPETDETFSVLLSNAVNGTINTASANCTIIDDDPPCLRIKDTSATENSQLAVVRVSLSSASSRTVRVKYDTKDGTAKAPGDYIKVNNGTLTFQPGETTKYITIVIKQDALYNEPTEKFQVILKDPENANIVTTASCIANKDATVSILNSVSQQNREILTKNDLNGSEETLAIDVPGMLPRYSRLTIRGLQGLDNELVIFDSKGIVVTKLQQYKQTWHPGNITAGIYFYQLRVKNKEGKFEVYRGKILITD